MKLDAVVAQIPCLLILPSEAPACVVFGAFQVETVKLDVKAESNRLERLEESKSTPGLDGA